jgi:hypothetical protein
VGNFLGPDLSDFLVRIPAALRPSGLFSLYFWGVFAPAVNYPQTYQQV